MDAKETMLLGIYHTFAPRPPAPRFLYRGLFNVVRLRSVVAADEPVTRAASARANTALTGTAFIASVAGMSNADRELAVGRELLAGNIPSFLRELRTVEVSGKGADSAQHSVAYEVMPDYLSIGSDKDYVRMPMTPYTAQAFCDAFDVVVSNLIAARPDRVVIYGWHELNGVPIQPMYSGHVNWYVDYSHGVRPVRRIMRVDGVRRAFEKIVADAVTLALLSDEGAINVARYPVPE